jgi:hypothetical protein
MSESESEYDGDLAHERTLQCRFKQLRVVLHENSGVPRAPEGGTRLPGGPRRNIHPTRPVEVEALVGENRTGDAIVSGKANGQGQCCPNMTGIPPTLPVRTMTGLAACVNNQVATPPAI